jgi:hypothetical protein
MRRKIDADDLIRDIQRRRQLIIEDKVNFDSTNGRLMQTGAIMALNNVIDIVKKLIEIEDKR